MAKETYYFSHDYNARSDEKIKLLIRKHGMAGYGIFWAIVEDLYQNANALRIDYDGIAYDLRTDSDIVKSVINDFGLFVFEGECFGSMSVQDRLDLRGLKSKKAAESANKRWAKNANVLKDDANALRSECESNAIKESKGKEIKEKEIIAAKAAALENRKNEFIEELKPFSKNYGGQFSPKMMVRFFDYWTELNPSKTKMRFQMQKTFEVSKRLVTWANRENENFSK
jgi:hypothetical protein